MTGLPITPCLTLWSSSSFKLKLIHRSWNKENKFNNSGLGPWSDWWSCDRCCGTYKSTRSRTCSNSQCLGPLSETRYQCKFTVSSTWSDKSYKIINNHTIQTVATANKMAEKVGKIGDGRLTIYLCRIFLVKINKLLNEILKSIGKYSVSHKLWAKVQYS